MNQNRAASMSFTAAEVILSRCAGPNLSSLQPLPSPDTPSPHIQGHAQACRCGAALKDKYQGLRGTHLQNNPLLWISVFHWGDSPLEQGSWLFPFCYRCWTEGVLPKAVKTAIFLQLLQNFGVFFFLRRADANSTYMDLKSKNGTPF